MLVPPAPPVRHPVMLQHWRLLTFLHWRYPAEVVQSHLPDGLTVQTHDGHAWVGLIPFLMDQVRPPHLPPLPWLSRFPETNVRTYVHGPDGHTGVWFLSLDAARAPAVLAGRIGYGLPYQWADMTVAATDGTVAYRSRRLGPTRPRATCHARARFGAHLTEPELRPLDHFLTARYRLYSTIAGRLVAADAHHPQWPLRRVELLDLHENLITATGLPAPSHQPVLHASNGVAVRIGSWHPVPRAR